MRAFADVRAFCSSGTPQPVEGRRHMDVQTELYLEELTDAPQETDAEAQTDAFLDRPATPLYVPLKVGMDVATQIEVGELFNFDVEVEPLLEVLVGKTLEQALQEVCEEEVRTPGDAPCPFTTAADQSNAIILPWVASSPR